MRLINADALIQVLEDYAKDDWSNTTMTTWAHAYVETVEIVEEQPTIEERNSGSWNIIQGNIVVCSECGRGAPERITGCLMNRHLEPDRTNFCPNCGADMRGEKV